MTGFLPPSKWTPDGAAVLKQFLSSKIGRQVLLQIAWMRPSLSIPGTILNAEAAALQSRFVAGYEEAIQRLLSLAEPPDDRGVQPVLQYPDLDDDTQWPEPPKREEAPAPAPAPVRGSPKNAEPNKV